MKAGSSGAEPTLARIQREFQSFVLGRRDTGIAKQVTMPPTGDADSRLAVYRDGYALRLVEALRSDYPALLAMLGEERFGELARAYVRSRRSHDPNLRWYGVGLSRFLCGRPDREDGLVEMAAWEWDLGLAFDARDASVVDAASLGEVPAERWPYIRLAFHASLQRLDLRTDVPHAWKRFREGAPPDPAALPDSIPWLIWRRDLEVRFRAMAEDEAWALDSARAGADFAALCAGLLHWKAEADVGTALVSYLRDWLCGGLVTEIAVD